jgi:TRAP transporter TAXI family solute receptor
MEKRYKLIVIVCFLIFLSFVGDGSTWAAEKAKPMKLSMTSATIGGNIYIISGALAKLIEEAVPGTNITVEPGQSGSNPILVGRGDFQLGTTLYSNASQAWDGRPPYKKPEKKVRGIGNLNINQYITIVALKETGVKTFQEIVDKKYPLKLVLHASSSTSATIIRWIFQAYGVSFDDLRSWGGSVTHVNSASDAVNLMKDKQVNAYGTIPSLRFPAFLDLESARRLNFIKFDRRIIDKVAKEKGLLTGSMPKGTYKDLEEDHYSIVDSQVIIANEKLPEAMAYVVAKTITENAHGRLSAAHGDMKYFDKNLAPRNTGFPLHKGAEEYYKEVGVLK